MSAKRFGRTLAFALTVAVAVEACGVAAEGLRDGDIVVFCGDSITCNAMNKPWGYRHQLEEVFKAEPTAPKNVKIVNLGFSGTALVDWRWIEQTSRTGLVQANEGSRAYPEESVNATFSNRVDVLVFCIGMNDVLCPHVADDDVAIRKWEADYLGLVRRLVERTNPRLTMLGTIPPNTNDPDGVRNRLMARMNAAIRRSAVAIGARVIDYHTALLGLTARIRTVSSDYQDTPDFVHPRELGNIVMAAEFLRAVGNGTLAEAMDRKLARRFSELVRPDPKAKIAYRIHPLSLDDPHAEKLRYEIEWMRRADGVRGRTPVEIVPDRIRNVITVEGEDIPLPAPWRVSAPFEGRKSPSEISEWKLTSGTFDYLGGLNPASVNYDQAWLGSQTDSFYACRRIYSGQDRTLPFEFRTEAFSNTYSFEVELNGMRVCASSLPRGKKKADGGVLQLKKGWNDLVILAGHNRWQRQFSFDFLPEAGDDLSDLRFDWRMAPEAKASGSGIRFTVRDFNAEDK